MKEIFLLLCLWMLNLTPASELPCEDHLGLGQNTGTGNLTFKLRATSGNASHIRINGTNAWKPVVNGQNFIQINISQPVLLTSLRLDGERGNTSRVTGFVLQTSYDCSTYDSQNYSVQYLMMDIPKTIPMKKVEYVKCLKIVPTNYTGSRAALRLDLIGCRVVKEETCQKQARPPTDIRLHAHTRKLMFDQEITLAWVAVQLLSNTSVLRSYVQLNYNLDCDASVITGYSFLHARSSNVTSDNQKSKWQILEFGYPIRVKCLYVMSSNRETIGKIYTNRCNSSGCGIKYSAVHGRSKRVINGQLNTLGQWPWLVSLHYLPVVNFTRISGYKHVCGGSVISPSWVLTAAHCFSDDNINGLSNVSNWKVYFGLHDLADNQNERVQMRLIEKVYIHPEFNYNLSQNLMDIALVHLSEPVRYTMYTSPICLDESQLFYNERRCTVTGWGQLEREYGAPGSRYPHSVTLRVMSPEECSLFFEVMIGNISHLHTMACTIEPDRDTPHIQDACEGDSGGPLMCEESGRWYQIGIVAWGFGCAMPALPSFHTRVTSFKSWIKDTMALEETNG